MGKFAVVIIVAAMAVFSLFAVFNKDLTTINVPFDKTYELPKIALLLASAMAGVLVTLTLFGVRDTRRFIISYKEQRKRKKSERIESEYARAADALLAENEAEAEQALDAVLKDAPAHVPALLKLGDIYAKLARFDDAADCYRKALAADEDNMQALFSLAGVLDRSGKPAEAMRQLDRILALDSDNVAAMHRKRALYERDGRWDDLVDLQKAVLKAERDPEDQKREQAQLLGYRYEQARDALERGDLEKATKGFRALVREDESFDPAHLGLVEALIGQDSTEEAAAHLEQAFASTGSQILLVRLEDLLISLGEPSRLLRTYRSAVSSSPHNDTLRFFLGKLYYRLEMVDDALEALSDMENPDACPDAHKLLGELYVRRDQFEKAVEHFKKTLDISRTLRVPYCCRICGNTADEWAGRCADCGNWNTVRFDLSGTCEV